MAVDKVVDSGQLNSDLTSIANAIRTKGGTSASLAFPNGFVTAIGNIQTGGTFAPHKALIVRAPDATSAQVNVTYNGITYTKVGDSFVFNEGDTISLKQSYGNSNDIYIDGVRVAWSASQGAAANYAYTGPAHDILITCTGATYTRAMYVTEDTAIKISKQDSLSVTANDTYTAPAGYLYNPVTVNVSGGGGSAIVVTETPDISGGVVKEITAVDISNDTVDAAHLLQGYTAHDNTGTAITGTYVAPTPTIQSLTVTPTTSQQTFNASGVDGYKPVTVNAIPSQYIVPSGNKAITENGTGIDVAAFATVSVDVQSSGGGKAAQIASGIGRVATTSYTAVSGQSITVEKTGTYDVHWVGWRSSTSGTNGSQLYIGNTAYGSAQTTFNSSYTNAQIVHLTGVSLTAGQTITVRARARGTSYYMYVMNLTIIEA